MEEQVKVVALVHKTKGFVFHHVPKTGGSSITNWLTHTFPDDLFWIGKKGVRRAYVGSKFFPGDKRMRNLFPAHIHPETIKNILRKGPRTRHLDTWHFGFMRDPYKWFESFFWYRRDRKEQNTKRNYGEGLFQADPEAAWKRFVEITTSGKSECTQSFWLKSNQNKIVSFIGDYSNLENDFKKVMNLFDVDVNSPLPVLNTRWREKSTVEHLPVEKIWHNEKLTKKIEEFLKEDIELYETTFNKRATYE